MLCRLQKERRKRWAEKQRGAVAEAGAAVAAFARAHPHGSTLTEEQKKEKEELEARVKLLAELDEKYEDLGGCCLRFQSFQLSLRLPRFLRVR